MRRSLHSRGWERRHGAPLENQRGCNHWVLGRAVQKGRTSSSLVHWVSTGRNCLSQGQWRMLVALTLRSTYLGQLLSVRHSGQRQQDSWRIWKQASETSGTPVGERGSECRPAAPPSLPAGCWPPWQGWAIRSGRPTVYHILVTLHTCSTLFFSFSYLVGYHQAHLTDKLLDNNQSPTVIPVA